VEVEIASAAVKLSVLLRLKLMNEIEAEVSGQVIEILVQNGEPVEFGQPLLRVNPLMITLLLSTI